MGLLSSIGSVFQKLAPVASVISPIAGAAASLVGAIGSNKAQKAANEQNLQIARENNETSIQIARENNEFAKQHAIDMFNMENTYNTPLAQMERFREAGLNPAVMMEGAGGAASGNSSGAGMVSPSMPTLTAPHMEAVPPMSMGFFDALSRLSQIKLTNAQAKKVGAETREIEQLLPEKLANLIADTEKKEVEAAYTELIRSIENSFGRNERAQRLKNMIADYSLAIAKGETEKAQKLFYDAEKELTETKNANEKMQAPVILENLRKTGRAIDASAAASRAAADASSAQAAKTREETRITRAEARIIEEVEDDIVFGRRLANAHQFQDLGEKSVTWLYRFEELKNRKLISDEQYNEIKEAVEHAKKENTAFWWDFAFDKAERISNAVAAYIPFAPERTTVSGGSSRFGSYDATTTRSKVMPWQQ